MYKKCLGNRVSRNKKEWKCHLCHYSMTFFEVEQHLLSDLHQAHLSQIDEEQRKHELDGVLELSGKERKKIVTNLITFDKCSSYLNCYVCKCKINGLLNTLKHINGSSHTQNFTNFIESNKKNFEKKPEKIPCNKAINAADADKSVQASISVLQSGLNDISCVKPTDPYYNNIIETKMPATPEIFKKCLENRITRDGQDYKCLLCKYVIKQSSFDAIEKHMQSVEHKEKLNKIDKEQREKESCKLLECSEEQGKKMVENLIIFERFSSCFYCCICMCRISGLSNVFQHIKGFLHKNNWVKYVEQNHQVIEKKTKIVSCNDLTTIKTAIEKSTNVQSVSDITTKTLKKIENVSDLEASTQELNKLSFSTENVQSISTSKPDVVANVLDNLVSLEFHDSQTGRLPSSAKKKLLRTLKLGNQRNPFATKVLRNGKNYINFCIDPGLENVYNFDSEKINILKLGVSLTFPYQTDRVCLPCGEQFPGDIQSLFEHLQNQEHLCNISKMQVEDKYFEDYPEQFSDLRLGKLYMQDMLNELIECYCCNVDIINKDEIIRQHAKESIHEEKSNLWKQQSDRLFDQYLTIYKDIWYYAEFFCCEICKIKCEFEIDFVKHLKSSKHMKNECQFKGVALTFDLCPSCITYWFGQNDSYEVHCRSDFHKRFARSKDFMVPNLTATASEFLDNIDENADLLESESDKTNTKKDEENVLLKAIEEAVKLIYPNAKAYIFGSRLSHLALPSSDVDVFLDCEDVYYTSSTQEQSQKYIKSVKKYLVKRPEIWLGYGDVLDTRVPIMRLGHIPTSLKCDISFINGLSVEKSRLVGLYNLAFPICRKLILFMKKWLILCRIFGHQYITAFAISWCVIFYLQLQGILPSVHELIKRKNISKIVDGWQCGYLEEFSVENFNLSFKEHLKGLFTYFANFDYQKSVICPYLGKAIDKRAFVHEYANQLPTEMNIYKERLENNEVEIFRFDSPMCIQDPVDLSQNMTKALQKRDLRCFRQYCILSAKKC